MTETCFYCQQVAVKQFKFQKRSDGKIVKPGVWCCSAFISQCPANRRRNSASNKARGEDWKLKSESTNLEKYGVSHAMKLESKKKYGAENSFAKPEFKQTMMTRYGVTNRSQIPGVGDKISETLSAKSKEWWSERSAKQRETAEANGNWMPECDISKMYEYRYRVSYETEKNYKEHQEFINPEKHIRSRYGNFHIDHIYSIRDAFLNDVPVEVVSHMCNLRMLSESDNKSKNGKSDITLEELYQRFNASKG